MLTLPPPGLGPPVEPPSLPRMARPTPPEMVPPPPPGMGQPPLPITAPPFPTQTIGNIGICSEGPVFTCVPVYPGMPPMNCGM